MRGRVVCDARLGKAAKHDQRITPPSAEGLGAREQIHQAWIVWPACLHGAPRQIVKGLVRPARSSVQRQLTTRFGFVAIDRCLPRVDDGRGGQERETDAGNKPAHADVRLTHPPIIEREITDSLLTKWWVVVVGGGWLPASPLAERTSAVSRISRLHVRIERRRVAGSRMLSPVPARIECPRCQRCGLVRHETVVKAAETEHYYYCGGCHFSWRAAQEVAVPENTSLPHRI